MEERKDFYVYVHTRATDGSIFYVGKGESKRAWSKVSRNRHWKYIVAKHDYNVTILLNNLTEEQAFILEKQTIATLGRENLCNMTDGGEGMSGFLHSEETRNKMSKSRKGNTNSKGRKLSDETKLKLSKANKGKKLSDKTKLKLSEVGKGRKQSPEHIAKRRAAQARNRLLRNLT